MAARAVGARCTVVTGAASGIGRSLVRLLRERGERIIGVDIKKGEQAEDVEIIADLSTQEGRKAMVDQVTSASGGSIDAIVANAGTAKYSRDCVSLNYFGAVKTLELLRPLLGKSQAPRAALTASIAAITQVSDELVHLMLQGKENEAVKLAEKMEKDPASSALLYSSSKRALCLWMRRTAGTGKQWQGIPLNGVGPTVIETPMVEPFLSTEEGRKAMEQMIPLPLHPGKWGHPDEVAKLLAFLVSADNSLMNGQMVFIDGGYDACKRVGDVFTCDKEEVVLSGLRKFAVSK